MAPEAELELFEENVDAFKVFDAMGTQWRRAGTAGTVTGMDYAPLPFVMRCCAVAPEREASVFSDLRLMENEALLIYAERSS
jgi:hypothetical protein